MKISEKFAQKQKKALLDEKSKLEKKIKKLDEFPEYGSGDDDSAKEFSDFENNQSIEAQLKSLIKKINTALRSIENKTYGKCLKCKKEIESGRLASIPYASVCVSCKKNEKK